MSEIAHFATEREVSCDCLICGQRFAASEAQFKNRNYDDRANFCPPCRMKRYILWRREFLNRFRPDRHLEESKP